MSKGNWVDDVVWTNLAYALSALPAWGNPLAFSVMLAAGLGISVASSVYHGTYERWAQQADVVAMMTYILALTITILVQVVPGLGQEVYLALPLGALFYALRAWDINSLVHVPAWSVLALLILAFEALWWTLLPVGLIALGGLVKLSDEGPDSLLHSLWHLSGAGAVGAALWLLF